MPEYDHIKYGTHDGVATIELARPDKLNAVSAQMFNDLGDACERASSDPGIRVVLLKGQGRAFCAGMDVNLLSQLSGTRGARFRTFIRSTQRPFLSLAQMEKPTIAAIQGHAIGTGFQLALACDLRIVSDDVHFAMAEVRFGLIPDLGGSHRLGRLIGAARAKEIIWTGRPIEAEEAGRLGIVNKIVARDDLDAEATRYVRDLVVSPPIPVALTKTLLNRAQESPLETALEREAQAQASCIDSEDHREAVEAYLAKRQPRFTGR